MFLTSMVPLNDRFNLILIQKLILYVLYVTANAQLNNRVSSFNYILKVDDFVDYSFDRLQLCEDVNIDLTSSNEPINGLLRSPDYRLNTNSFQFNNRFNLPITTKCKWTIKAPKDYKIELKIVDYEIKTDSKCPNDHLEFKIPETNLIWINLSDETDDQKTTKYIQNTSISNCDYDLKSYLTLTTDSNQLEIIYSTINSNLNVLISFTARRDEFTCDENSIQCTNKHESNLKQISCINKNLLCNCQGFLNKTNDNCDYLRTTYDDYLNLLSLPQEDYCEYYTLLNTRCRNSPQNRIIEPDLEDICYNVIKTKEFGWVASPNLYSSKYANLNLNCTYRIILQPYQTIQLRFKMFDGKRRKNDTDFLEIHDGSNYKSQVLARFSLNQDFKSTFHAKVFNSKTNELYIRFQTTLSRLSFNFTYQIKGYCIENQKQCNSIYELNCYSPEQTCNDVWDCNNGADERGCFGCAPDRFRCKNNIFCYRLEDRCDGDHQCVDKSDELNCDKWNCNSANGTFLCANGRCIYEQWVCDGANDCEDNSDEINCPTGLTSRRVITTAVLGGTLCCLLLVMALGCACKLYTLHTATYRGSFRFAGQRPRRRVRQRQNLSSFIRRLRTDPAPPRSETTNTLLSENTPNELPTPHHLIAPPTYNQTMGLVDEYEQRQLAFIEHVRTILSQQNGINLNPQNQPASIYRLNRRSHRHRHNRDPDRRRRHRHANTQINFDTNRRGLNETEVQPVEVRPVTTSTESSVLRPVDTNQTQTQVKTSDNLRNRIARLIKDIVVHHGDNIQYVQLGDRQSQLQDVQASGSGGQRDENGQNQTNSEDDVPLIQP